MMTISRSSGVALREDSFAGCLLGLAIGDALGMPFEGMDTRAIRASHGLDNLPPHLVAQVEDSERLRGLGCAIYQLVSSKGAH